MRRVASKTLCALVGSVVVIGGTAAFSTAAAAATPAPAAARVGATPALPAGSTLVGALSTSSKIDATVALRSSNAAALSAYATAVSTRGTKQYHHYLSTAGFAAAFGPSAATVSAVEAVLKRDGLSPGAVSANHLAIQIHGTSARMAAAFQTTFRQYRVAGGRIAYANTSAPLLDGSIAASVQGVIGLNNLVLAHHQGAKLTGKTSASQRAAAPHVVTGGPQPCQAVKTAQTNNAGSLTADQIASAYKFSSLYGAGDLGAGQSVAVYELETNKTSDIAAYQSCYGTSAAISYKKIDGGSAPNTGGAVESTLDIEDVIGIAPAAAQIVYQGPNSGSGGFDTFNAIISDDTSSVITTSWGSCELNSDADSVAAENTIFQEAATQGQSLFDASGDLGSEDCGTGALSADDPGGQPFVTVVGGTLLTVNSAGTTTSEVLWNSGGGGGGAGISKFFPMPSYQTNAAASLNVINAESNGTPCGAAAGSYCRQEPDVSLVASPDSGALVYVDGGWVSVGGTSSAAPLWAAYTALVNASAACGGTNVGFVNPTLYSIGGSAYAANFNDITSGNSDVTGTNGGLYHTAVGYDIPTGLGTPKGDALAASFCPSSPTAPAFTADTPPTAGTVGSAYSYTYVATGNPAPTFAVASGALPAGLTLSTAGVLSGTPTTAGPATFTVSASNGIGSPAVSPSTTITVAAVTNTGPTIDTSVTKTGTNSITAALSTTVAGDTVVAFVSGDGSKTVAQHATVTGGGLSWSRVKCTCGKNGTAEIWKAKATGKLTNAAIKSTLANTGFSVSETVIAFSNTTGVGAKTSMTAMTGFPKATLTTTAANSLVFGVGTDPVTATARTVGAGQTLFSQVFSGANTYWVQSTTTPVAAGGTAVTISDPAPKGHGWSLAAVEIL